MVHVGQTVSSAGVAQHEGTDVSPELVVRLPTKQRAVITFVDELCARIEVVDHNEDAQDIYKRIGKEAKHDGYREDGPSRQHNVERISAAINLPQHPDQVAGNQPRLQGLAGAAGRP